MTSRALLRVLDPSVVLTSDGGGLVRAARRPVQGADRVARFLIGVAERIPPSQRLRYLTVNGGPGFGIVDGDHTVVVCALTIHNRLITRVDLVLAPDKLPTPNQP